MRFPSSPSFPRLTKAERRLINRICWARKILREAPDEMVRRAALIEQFTAATGLPERGAHHADPKGRSA